MKNKGFLMSFTVGFFALLFIVLLVVLQQLSGVHTKQLTFNQAELLQNKINLEKKEKFIERAVYYSGTEAAYKNGLKGGFKDFSDCVKKSDNLCFWRDENPFKINIPPESDLEREIIRETNIQFNPYVNEDWLQNLTPFEFYFRGHNNTEFVIGTEAKLKNKKNMFEIKTNPSNLSTIIPSKYFLQYKKGKDFAQDLVFEGTDLHQSLRGDVEGLDDYYSDTNIGCVSCSIPSDRTDVPSTDEMKNLIENRLIQIEKQLNTSTQNLKIGWKLKLVDFGGNEWEDVEYEDTDKSSVGDCNCETFCDETGDCTTSCDTEYKCEAEYAHRYKITPDIEVNIVDEKWKVLRESGFQTMSFRFGLEDKIDDNICDDGICSNI